MPDQNQNINVSMNMGSTFTDLKALEEALRAGGIAVQQLAQRAIELNKSGQGSTVFLRAMTDDMKQADVTVQKLGETMNVLKVRVTDTGAAQRKAAQETRDAAQAQKDSAREIADAIEKQNRAAASSLQVSDRLRNQQAALAAGAQFRSAFPAPSGATIQLLATYEAQVRRIVDLVQSGKLNASDVGRITSGVTGGQILSNLNTAGANLQKQLVGLQNQFNATLAPANALSSAWTRFTSLVERFVIRRILFGAFQAIQSGIRDFVQLEIQVGRVAAAGQSLGITFQNASNSIRLISSETGFQRLDVAAASLQVLQQRATSGTEAMQVLSQGARLARASGADLQQGVQALVETLNGFNISNARSGEVIGILHTVSQAAHTSVQALGADFARLAPLAQSLGVNIGTVSAFMLTLTDQGFTAQRATEALQTVMQHLLTPSRELQQVFRSWGVDSGPQAIAAFGGIDGVLARLQNQFRNNAGELEKLVPGIHNISTAFNGTAESIQRFQNNLSRATGGTARVIEDAARASQNQGQKLIELFKNIKDIISDSVGNIVSFFAKAGEAVGDFLSRFTALRELFKSASLEAQRFQQAANAAFDRRESRENERQDAQLASSVQALRAAQATINQGFNQIFDAASANLRNAQENLKAVTAAIVSDLNDKLRKINETASEAHRIGEAAKKSLATAPERASERSFQARLSAEGDLTRATALIDSRIRSQQALIQSSAGNTDEASVAANQQRFQDILRLQQERFRLQQQVAQQRFQTFGEGREQVFNPNTQQFDTRVNLSRQNAEYERQTAETERQQTEFLERQIRLQQQREASARIQAAEQHAQNAAREIALRQLQAFRATDDQGNILPRFQRGTREESQRAAEAEFQRLQQNFQQTFSAEELRILQERYGFQTSSEHDLAAVRDQLDAAYSREASRRASDRIAQEEREALEARQRAFETARAAQQGTSAAGVGIGQAVDTLRNRLAFLDVPAERIREIAENLDRVNRLQQELIANQSTDSSQQAAERIRLLTEATNRVRGDLNPNDRTGAQLLRSLESLLQNARQFQVAQKAYEDAAEKVNALNTRFAALTGQINALPRAAQEAGQQVQAAIGEVNRAAETLEQTFARIIRQQQAIRDNRPQFPVIAPGAGAGAGAPAAGAVGLAKGGWVPGSGNGDTVAAMLTPGEFVVNKNAAQNFAPVVEALNRGMPPDSGAAPGFSSVTNVGDITVNLVGGNKHSDQHARDIAYALRREIRRGTISQDQLTN